MITEESNKLIAEFMQKGSEGLGLYDYKNRHYTLDELKFNTSWDWLMPVVEKIENITLFAESEESVNVTIGATNYCIIQASNRGVLEIVREGETKLLSVYKAVATFIEWFNSRD